MFFHYTNAAGCCIISLPYIWIKSADESLERIVIQMAIDYAHYVITLSTDDDKDLRVLVLRFSRIVFINDAAPADGLIRLIWA